MANSAHVYRAKSGNFNFSFHHPVVRDGSVGKKVHRSLKVSDEDEAARLKQQLDELISLATYNPTLLPPRSEAGQKYEAVIVDAFFDCMTPEPIDYAALRERLMRMPPRQWVPHVLIAGGTGVGKSRLAQHLLQTTYENFPMRGAGRTTVSDTEIIVTDADYSAAITFFSEREIRQTIKENVLEACAFSVGETDPGKIAAKLLVDSDKRFRFNFVLGNWKNDAGTSDELDDDDSVDDVEPRRTSDLKNRRWEGIDACIESVIELGQSAVRRASSEGRGIVDTSESDDWLQYVDQERVDAIAEEILTELEARLCDATGERTWPRTHFIEATPDRAAFFDKLQRFCQNHRKDFGLLVTPLVQGVRVRGRFFPPDWTGDKLRDWVLLDGQGVGHEQSQPTNVDRTLPPDLARKFATADLICLVDRAVPAMTGDAPTVLEHLLTRGYLDRLLLVFTNFESVNAPDLDPQGRKSKVLEGLSNAIQSIVLPKTQRVLLERNALSQSYFLSKLNFDMLQTKSTRQAITSICERIASGRATEPMKDVRPIYNEYEIANIVSGEISSYRHDWSEGSLATRNYKIIEALTNWIGNAFSDGYPRQRLYPGQNLSERIVSAISVHLDSPREWSPTTPTEQQQSEILNAIRTKVASRFDKYCRQVIIQDPRTSRWLPAYQNIYGVGTLRKRARTVARILEDQAELPEEGVGKFAKDIWHLVDASIHEVCNAKHAE